MNEKSINMCGATINQRALALGRMEALKNGEPSTVRCSGTQLAEVIDMSLGLKDCHTVVSSENEPDISILMAKYAPNTICGIPLIVDDKMTRDEIRFEDKEGRILSRIYDLKFQEDFE